MRHPERWDRGVTRETAKEPGATETADTPLTFEDVAYLLCGGEIDPPEATLARLTPHLRSDPRLADQVRDLDRLTREAGAELPFEALRTESLLEQLLAKVGWQHPRDVIPADVLEVYYPRLIRLAGLRAESAGSPEPLRTVRERLVEAQADLEAGDELLPLGARHRSRRSWPPPRASLRAEGRTPDLGCHLVQHFQRRQRERQGQNRQPPERQRRNLGRALARALADGRSDGETQAGTTSGTPRDGRHGASLAIDHGPDRRKAGRGSLIKSPQLAVCVEVEPWKLKDSERRFELTQESQVPGRRIELE